MEKPQTWFARLLCKNTSPCQDRCVFFIVYLLLLIIITNAIIKAKAMIVTPINE